MTIAIKHATTGEIQFVESLNGYAIPDWAQYGPGLPANWREFVGPKLVSGAWVEDAAQVEMALIAAVKLLAEQRKMEVATVGGYKKTEYAAKRAEVNAFDALGSTLTAVLAALNLIPAATRATRFAYAYADAAAFGDTIDKAIERFRTGMNASSKAATLAAAEAKGCAAIRAASTAAAKRAAFAAINWGS